ncbi:PTS glucose/sucrose transporter subunit IIB [Streptomyces sp. NPDC094472]
MWCRPVVARRDPLKESIVPSDEGLPHPHNGVDHLPQRGHHADSRTTGANMATKADKIVEGLGGIDNIVEIEGCITRLRTEVKDAALVDEALLKAAGAHGVVKMGTAIQVVIGADADPVAAEIEDLM